MTQRDNKPDRGARGKHTRLHSLGLALVIAAPAGYNMTSKELYDEFLASLITYSRDPVRRDLSTPERLQVAFGYLEMWDIVLSFRKPTVPRSLLLHRCLRFAELHAASEHVERAIETANILREMLAEEATFRQPMDRASLPLEEWIEVLIFQLRDQTGRQVMQPGWVSVLHSTSQEDPASALVEIGLDAVPALIESLDDQHLSRAVGYHRNSSFSHRPLTIGECCGQILSRITGQSFRPPGKRIRPAQRKENARAWWRKMQEKR